MENKIVKKQLTKDEALAKLWEIGELTWLLSPVQRKMKNTIFNDSSRTSVIVSSRRLGKTWLLVTLALEQCLREPNSIVKFLLPKQKDTKIIIKPLMREILDTCPKHLRPKFNSKDSTYEFPNGSEIHMGGSDLSAESLRGTRANLVLVDEAGFISDLSYCIKSILSPTIRTTRGRMIMASTPSRSPDHEFITQYMNPYKASGRLQIYTIYDNPNFTEDVVQEIISEYPLGVDDPDFRREYMCEVTIDEEQTIVPEFTRNKHSIVVNDIKLPEYRDFYVSMDIGIKDLTIAIFCFYDFNQATLYVIDELVMNGPTMTTKSLADEIREKEKIWFHKDGVDYSPYMRVSDNDLKLVNDMALLHDMVFVVAKKENKEAALNEMRMWIQQSRVKIHERCRHLIYHLEYGQWNNKRTDFKRLADTPDKSIKGGHVDGIPALYYLIRMLQTTKNPFPSTYGFSMGGDTFVSPKWLSKNVSQATDFMEKLMNIRKK